MEYFIGMDGGGTKTACLAVDSTGKAVYNTIGGPSNFLMLGDDKVARMLLSLIEECRENLKCEYSDFRGIVLGTTGAGRRHDAERLESAFASLAAEKGLSMPFHVESDARVALEGAFSGKPGSILIAGTGSIMFGKDSQGNIHRVGGFGRFIGDQGSGYALGRRGLTMVAKEMDGRGDTTLLTELVRDKFSITNAPEIITAIYGNNFDMASVAPLVMQAAEQDDDVCLNIVEEETQELVLHLCAMQRKIDEPVLRVAPIGSIITTDNFFSRMFRQKVERLCSNVMLSKPELSPEMGAVLMARQIAGL